MEREMERRGEKTEGGCVLAVLQPPVAITIIISCKHSREKSVF